MSDTLVGEVVYWRDEPRESSGWHVIVMKGLNGQDCTVTGCNLPRPGCRAELQGEWEHTKWGEQFHARSVLSTKPPLTAAGVALWLEDRCDGIGKAKAAAIMQHFGGDPVALWSSLHRGADELAAVPGIGAALAEHVHEAFVVDGASREHYATLREMRLTQAQISRVLKHWPRVDDACKRLYDDPYLLAEHVSGFGFKRADEIAVKCGIKKHDKQRVRAGILHHLNEAAQQGHVFGTYTTFVYMANAFLGVPIEQVVTVLQELLDAKRLVTPDGARIYLPTFERAEATAARCTLELLSLDAGPASGGVSVRAAKRALETTGHTLHPRQLEAIELMANTARPIGFITGGPGTGKTTILEYAVAELEAQGVEVILAAPTGKAARRMAEVTRRDAMTLHRMLEYRPEHVIDCETCKLATGSFKRVDVTVPCVIIVDEASMVDLQLWSALMGAIERGGNVAVVRFVGDADQLPPVGAGQPFADHLRALSEPDLGKPATTVVRLESAFRQGVTSWVAASAPLVLAGKMLDLAPRHDFRFVTEVRADHVPAAIEALLHGEHDAPDWSAAVLAADYTPKRGLSTGIPAPVLVPQNKGLAGVSVINRLLSEHYNPHAAAMSEQDLVRIPLEDGTDLRVRARVLITKNDYARQVRNGDTGVIESMDLETDKRGKPQPITWVRLDPDETTARKRLEAKEAGLPLPLTPLVKYTFKQAREELSLAYAMTIHKAQGSQYPWVVVVCHSTHTRMLTRRLLYTALTRASEGVVIVGNREGIQRAVGNANELPRLTQLSERIRGGLVQ